MGEKPVAEGEFSGGENRSLVTAALRVAADVTDLHQQPGDRIGGCGEDRDAGAIDDFALQQIHNKPTDQDTIRAQRE
ncbi:hypothetical protein [Cryobacterium sp. Hz9]|uniref:hypothetical protein n=1 Tax=Cryobacterium sp. Hz9 TaxID=1259167 RepID=UPI00141B1B7C